MKSRFDNKYYLLDISKFEESEFSLDFRKFLLHQWMTTDIHSSVLSEGWFSRYILGPNCKNLCWQDNG